HWEKNIDKFRHFYDSIIDNAKGFANKFSFERYVEESDNFLTWSFDHVDWKTYDIIGFTSNYGQFLPSLALAKKIKENYPKKTIVFGGSSTINELGIRLLKTFHWIDFIVSGEGEEALFLLASDYENYKSIPGLIFRKKEVIWNKNDNFVDLNNLPIPDFQSYYKDLNMVSDEIKQYHYLYGRMPIELSRGCWWNKCTFCNICAYNKKYREKSVDRFIEELDFLSNTYKILTFQIIGNTLPQHDFRILCEQIIKLGKSFDFYVEARAGSLKSEDYSLLDKAGFNHIQTGIETFSPNYLKKMNKGVKIIDNIAALKYCKENNITNTYNIIVNYPNEEPKDFEETKKTIEFFKRYLSPPQISNFVVGFESPIYKNYDKFNIERLEHKTIDTIIYPTEVLENNFCFFSQFKRKQEHKENNWKQLVEEWRKEYEQQAIEGLRRKTTLDQLVFYYVDGGRFVKIFDGRNREKVMIYILDQLEREIFLSCIDVISYGELQERFVDVSEESIKDILNSFEKTRIVFKEGDQYLSLPLSYNKICGSFKEKKQQQDSKVIQLS
ncbi:MAG: RiPP maturation radical SAM C-methyltransferase, partial [Thermoplasmatales archaeon]